MRRRSSASPFCSKAFVNTLTGSATLRKFLFRHLLFSLAASALALTFSYTLGVAGGDVPRRATQSPAGFSLKRLDVNRINCVITNDGGFADYRQTNSSGLEWPKGSGKTAVFTGGIFIAGKESATNELRIAAASYGSNYRPGTIDGVFSGDPSVASDSGNPAFRVYKIQRSDTAGGMNADYDEWPADQGAPTDQFGKPKFFGEQQLFAVFNDLDTGTVYPPKTSPLGVEVRALYWADNSVGFLQDVMYMQWEIINKSSFAYESTYVGIWSDVDMGQANDDQAGCDTTVHLGYVYNGFDVDDSQHGYGDKPPAVGIQLLSSPIGYDGFPLGMTSFVVTADPLEPWFQDLPGGDDFPMTAYRYMSGLNFFGSPMVNPVTGAATTFAFSGDPATREGWVAEGWRILGDLRMFVNTGPFYLAPGDTQRVVAALFLAQGDDRFLSLQKLRMTAGALKALYHGEADTTVRVFPYLTLTPNDLPTLTAKVLLTTSNVTHAWASLYPQDSSEVYSKELYDDGLHEDGAAGDGVFGDLPFDITQTQAPLRVDVTCQTTHGDTRIFSPLVTTIPTIKRLEAVNPRVLVDSLNPDGVINQGDVAHLAFDLMNPNGIAIDSISITAIFADDVLARDSILVSEVAAFTALQGAGAFELIVPDDAPVGCCKKLIVSIRERLYNATWKDTLAFDIAPYIYNPLVSVAEHVEGTAQGAFGYRIEDARQLKEHKYRIVIPASYRLTLVDYTSGDTLYADHMFPSDSLGTNMPLSDGFRLTTGTTQRSNGQILGVYEVRGPGGAPVAPSPGQPAGDPGRDVFMRANSTDQWSVINAPPEPPSVRYLNSFYPAAANSRGDYELRFTPTGSEYYRGPSKDSLLMKAVGRVSVETWDVGEPGSDAVDDVRLVPRILDANSNGSWDVSADSTTSEPVYTTTVPPYIEPLPDPSPFLFVGRFRVGNITFYRGPAGSFSMPAEGTVLRLVVSRTPAPGDLYTFMPMRLLPVETAGELPSGFALLQNYPNPFNPSTTIRYGLPTRSHVTLTVFNTLGQQVATLVEGEQEAGFHEAVFDASGLASGVYLYRLQTGDFVETKRLLCRLCLLK